MTPNFAFPCLSFVFVFVFVNTGYLAFTWENQKFRMENQMVCAILFGKLQELWAMIQGDAIFVYPF